MNIATFSKTCLQNKAALGFQGDDYFETQAVRLFETYRLCRKLLKAGDHILSIGAGSAFVEKVLAQELKVSVTVVDFPEAIALNQRYYAQCGFTAVAGNVLTDDLDLTAADFDAILCAEVVEHIPLAPSVLFRKVAPLLKKNGILLVSTPNFGSISHLVKLLCMRPIIAPPEQTFAAVDFENEGTHRREYVPMEIIQAMRSAGVRHLSTRFFRYFRPRSAIQKLLLPFHALTPRFKPGMIIVGKKT